MAGGSCIKGLLKAPGHPVPSLGPPLSLKRKTATFVFDREKKIPTSLMAVGDTQRDKVNIFPSNFLKRKLLLKGHVILTEGYISQSDNAIKCPLFQADIRWEKWSTTPLPLHPAHSSFPSSLCHQHLQVKNDFGK